MTKVLQIMPDDGVGGVELAARAAVERQGDAMRVFVLDDLKDPLPRLPGITYGHARPGGPTSALRALKAANDQKPDVIVFSLWKTWLAFLLIRFFGPRAKLVTFLHCDRPHHRLDGAVTHAMMVLSDGVWADSEETLRLRKAPVGKITRAISFLLHRPPAAPPRQAGPDFVFWGRIKRQKRIDLAVRLIARLQGARLLVIGPDGGEEAEVRRVAAELGMGDRVTFAGPRPFDEIPPLVADSAFYIQCSSHEGMSMSTVEAMQLGLVPVVTPVGEIARYCRHLDNAVLIDSEEQAAADIARLLDDPAEYARLSSAAVDRWADAPLYDEDFMAAAEQLAAKG